MSGEPVQHSLALELAHIDNPILLFDHKHPSHFGDRRSGAEVNQRLAMLYTVRPEDGKVIHAQLLPDVQEAISVAESASSQSA